MNLGHQHCTPLQVCLHGCVCSCMCLRGHPVTCQYLIAVGICSVSVETASSISTVHVLRTRFPRAAAVRPRPSPVFTDGLKTPCAASTEVSLFFWTDLFHHPHLYRKADLTLILKKLSDLFFSCSMEMIQGYVLFLFVCFLLLLTLTWAVNRLSGTAPREITW